MRHTLQKGFTLLELSFTTVLLTMGIVAMIQLQGYQAQLEVARSVAQIYQRINNAAGGYLVNYYDVLKDLPADCSNTGLRGATVVNAPAGPPLAGCNRALGQVNVANALQPTLDELRQLGLLNGADGAQFNNVLPLPTFGGSQGNPFQMLDADGKIAAPAFGVLIQKVQVAGSQDLRSLVYNRQPFNLEGTSRAGGILLDEMLLAAGGDAYLSDNQPASAGQLRAQAGAAEPTMPNPLQVAGPNGVVLGAPFVFAMRNGYGSAGFDRYVRRDGSTPLTGNWNVGGKDITGVNTLQGQSGNFANSLAVGANNQVVKINGGNITADGNLSAKDGTFKGNVSGVDGKFTGNVSGQNGTFSGAVAGNTVTANTVTGQDGGVFGNFTEQVSAALKATSAYISGALTVAGDALFKGNLNVDKDGLFKGALTANGVLTANGALTANGRTELKGDSTNVANLRLQNEANLDAPCNPDLETLRKAIAPANEPSLKLLVCDPISKVWVRAQTDYAGAIGGINQTIGGINQTIGGINSLIGTTSLVDLPRRVQNLENTVNNEKTGISALNSGLLDLNNIIKGVNNKPGLVSTVETMNTALNGNGTANNPGLISDVSTLKKARWDIVNIAWRPADKNSDGTWTAKTGVWKKTPWRCNNLGDLNQYQSSITTGGFDGVKWLQYASQNVPNLPDASTTPPIFLGLDDAPGEQIVYDINCGTPDQTGDYSGSYWYVGISAKASNQANGNQCRSGLGSILTGPLSPMKTYDGGAYENKQCKNFNVYAPSFNPALMSARFIAFSRAP